MITLDNKMQVEPILAVEGLRVALPKGADRPFAVDDVSFTLKPGEILCVVGESGSGKSVLSSAVMGAPPSGLKVAGGSVRLGGRELMGQSERAWQAIRGKEIAMIFQEPMASLNPAVRVGRQIEEVFELHADWPRAKRQERALALIREMHLPDPERIAASYPHQLSGGQCQRIVIAMALAMNPRVLIADEPTTALDVTTQAQVLRLVRELRDKHGHAIVFITHDFGVVAEIADRIAVMRYGKIVEIGEAKQILQHPQHEYTRQLIAAVPSMVPAERPPIPKEAVEHPALKAEQIVKQYGTVRALDGVSLTLPKGTTIAVVGESGSGKSTLARVVVRLTDANQGHAFVDGVDFLKLVGAELRRHRRAIQMVFQDPFGSLNPRRRVGDIITRAGVLAGQPPAAAKERAYELLELVGLPRQAFDRRPSAFSGGQRQRIGIARALAMSPEILIADESVSALDVSVQAQVLELLKDLQAKLGLSILFITHDLRVAAQISDWIAVIQRGQVVEFGKAAVVLSTPRHPYTQTLIASAPGRSHF